MTESQTTTRQLAAQSIDDVIARVRNHARQWPIIPSKSRSDVTDADIVTSLRSFADSLVSDIETESAGNLDRARRTALEIASLAVFFLARKP